MNNSLSTEQINLIKNNGWVIFSTSDEKNFPRAIIVQPSRIETNRMIISNIQMGKSIQNVKSNHKCFINSYLKDHSDMQIKITGTANVYEDGNLYDEIKKYEETNNLPEDLKVSSIIIVEFESIEITKE